MADIANPVETGYRLIRLEIKFHTHTIKFRVGEWTIPGDDIDDAISYMDKNHILHILHSKCRPKFCENALKEFIEDKTFIGTCVEEKKYRSRNVISSAHKRDVEKLLLTHMRGCPTCMKIDIIPNQQPGCDNGPAPEDPDASTTTTVTTSTRKRKRKDDDDDDVTPPKRRKKAEDDATLTRKRKRKDDDDDDAAAPPKRRKRVENIGTVISVESDDDEDDENLRIAIANSILESRPVF